MIMSTGPLLRITATSFSLFQATVSESSGAVEKKVSIRLIDFFPEVELRRVVSRYLNCTIYALNFFRVSIVFALELHSHIIPYSLSNTLRVAQKR